MIESGRLDVEEFVTMAPIQFNGPNLLKTLRTTKDVYEAYRGYENSKVWMGLCVRMRMQVCVFALASLSYGLVARLGNGSTLAACVRPIVQCLVVSSMGVERPSE